MEKNENIRLKFSNYNNIQNCIIKYEYIVTDPSYENDENYYTEKIGTDSETYYELQTDVYIGRTNHYFIILEKDLETNCESDNCKLCLKENITYCITCKNNSEIIETNGKIEYKICYGEETTDIESSITESDGDTQEESEEKKESETDKSTEENKESETDKSTEENKESETEKSTEEKKESETDKSTEENKESETDKNTESNKESQTDKNTENNEESESDKNTENNEKSETDKSTDNNMESNTDKTEAETKKEIPVTEKTEDNKEDKETYITEDNYSNKESQTEEKQNENECTIDKILNNNCKDGKLSDEQIQVCYDKFKEEYLNSGNKSDNQIVETQNAVFQFSTVEYQQNNIQPNVSSIDLGECESILKKNIIYQMMNH